MFQKGIYEWMIQFCVMNTGICKPKVNLTCLPRFVFPLIAYQGNHYGPESKHKGKPNDMKLSSP